jgi:molybdopterin-guanine dinucleotide biosynthesis protein A
MLSVAIQAGGKSERMGRDKAGVLLAGRPLITHVLERVAHLGADILVTTNAPDDYAFLGVRLVADEQPGAGALAGLQTALRAARCETVLVLACDLPFVCLPLLEHLLRLAPQADAVVPRWRGEYEPLHAIYNRTCLPAIDRSLAEGRRRMISFLPAVRLTVVEEDQVAAYDPQGLTFFNVNTPDDLQAAERILAGADHPAQAPPEDR